MAAADIGDAEVNRVECATLAVFIYRKHHWKFDVRTGACTEKSTHALKSFETQVNEGRLMARC